MAIRTEQVRLAFEQPEWYLNKRPNIQIRADTVSAFLKDVAFDSILDVGCGDGSLSLPLLTADRRLTLLDLSSAMLSAALSTVPLPLRRNVDIVHEDFLRATLDDHTYDLILCLGVLAHVESPSAVIAKIAALSKPGGSVIAESADCRHLSSRLLAFYDKVRDRLIPATYSRNILSSAEVVEMFCKHGFTLVRVYRYGLLSLPGLHRLFPHSCLYRMMRMTYGTAIRNRNARLGNECIYHFRKD